MKHHFGEMLDREGDYWTVVPNRERYAYSIGELPSHSEEITIVTIGKHDPNWERVLTFPNLQEVTLHEPTKEQLEALSELTEITRLRITHARPKTLEFLSSLVNVEELVLEYVSGFSDLSPLQTLTSLKSLHLENLRKVSDFSGLEGLHSLRYLNISGTLDWKQPIAHFEFLRGLPNLELLSFWQVITKADYPALLPLTSLKKLKKIKLANNVFAADEYALLTVALPHVNGANWEAFTKRFNSYMPLPKDDIRFHLDESVLKEKHPEVRIQYKGIREIGDPKDAWFEFTGKSAGRTKTTSPNCKAKCDDYWAKFEAMKTNASKLL